jgi:hypothetical protein
MEVKLNQENSNINRNRSSIVDDDFPEKLKL